MNIITRERAAVNNQAMVKQVPYLRIARAIDSFKNQCIFPESTDFKERNYSQFDISVFRNIY